MFGKSNRGPVKKSKASKDYIALDPTAEIAKQITVELRSKWMETLSSPRNPLEKEKDNKTDLITQGASNDEAFNRVLKLYEREISNTGAYDLGLQSPNRTALRATCKDVIVEVSSYVRNKSFSNTSRNSGVVDEILANSENAMTALKKLVTERNTMNRMGFVSEALALDAEIAKMETAAAIAKHKEEQEILERELNILNNKAERRRDRKETEFDVKFQHLRADHNVKYEKLKEKQKGEVLGHLKAMELRAIGKAKSCACVDWYNCRHNKTTSFNNRRAKPDVIVLKRNSQRLKRSGRIDEAAEWQEKAMDLDSDHQDDWRKKIATSIGASPWGANEATIDQLIAKHKHQLQTLKRTLAFEVEQLSKCKETELRILDNFTECERGRTRLKVRNSLLAHNKFAQEMRDRLKEEELYGAADANFAQDLMAAMGNDAYDEIQKRSKSGKKGIKYEEETEIYWNKFSERAEQEEVWVPPSHAGLDNSENIIQRDDETNERIDDNLETAQRELRNRGYDDIVLKPKPPLHLNSPTGASPLVQSRVSTPQDSERGSDDEEQAGSDDKSGLFSSTFGNSFASPSAFGNSAFSSNTLNSPTFAPAPAPAPAFGGSSGFGNSSGFGAGGFGSSFDSFGTTPTTVATPAHVPISTPNVNGFDSGGFGDSGGMGSFGSTSPIQTTKPIVVEEGEKVKESPRYVGSSFGADFASDSFGQQSQSLTNEKEEVGYMSSFGAGFASDSFGQQQSKPTPPIEDKVEKTEESPRYVGSSFGAGFASDSFGQDPNTSSSPLLEGRKVRFSDDQKSKPDVFESQQSEIPELNHDPSISLSQGKELHPSLSNSSFTNNNNNNNNNSEEDDDSNEKDDDNNEGNDDSDEQNNDDGSLDGNDDFGTDDEGTELGSQASNFTGSTLADTGKEVVLSRAILASHNNSHDENDVVVASPVPAARVKKIKRCDGAPVDSLNKEISETNVGFSSSGGGFGSGNNAFGTSSFSGGFDNNNTFGNNDVVEKPIIENGFGNSSSSTQTFGNNTFGSIGNTAEKFGSSNAFSLNNGGDQSQSQSDNLLEEKIKKSLPNSKKPFIGLDGLRNKEVHEYSGLDKVPPAYAETLDGLSGFSISSK